MYNLFRYFFVVIIFITEIMAHKCDYETCYNACYGYGQSCVDRCYSNCMNN